MKPIVIAILIAGSLAARAGAEERPRHDPAVEKAAIAILQKKLPELRGGLSAAGPQRLAGSAPSDLDRLVDGRQPARFNGRIVW
ncbi:hypothetical protein [Ensifer soli]|uniref:hypothetical protein n=1 Tax=Ciceribacter sp. sgz301302 TaxID=3342379 RepID=UPI0035BA56B5